MTNLISFKIIKRNIEKKLYPINIAAVSRAIGTTPTCIFYNTEGMRKWSAENWLKTMACLGSLEISKNGKEIIIKSDLTKEEIKELNSLMASSYERGN